MGRARRKVAVAMSGGVDSSVAALLLKEAGYEVVGFTMLREGTSVKGGKVSDQEVEEAKKVCSFLGIEHFLLNVTQTLEEKVIKPFIQEYREGKTPNPCVNCNRFVKFGALWDEIALRGFDYLATGHYARLQEKDGRPVLMKARDISKDQSYFLHAVDRASLAKVIFPLGDYTKTQVRQWAKERRIPTAERKESQDICFIPADGYGAFLSERGVTIEPGDFVDRQGHPMGKHRGSLLYTVGQRARLGGIRSGRLYVISVDPMRNLVFLGKREDLLSRRLVADRVNILVDDLPLRCEAKIRYAHRPVACRVEMEAEKLTVTFDEPQEAVTPGQFVVLYFGEVVLGGGRIIASGR